MDFLRSWFFSRRASDKPVENPKQGNAPRTSEGPAEENGNIHVSKSNNKKRSYIKRNSRQKEIKNEEHQKEQQQLGKKNLSAEKPPEVEKEKEKTKTLKACKKEQEPDDEEKTQFEKTSAPERPARSKSNTADQLAAKKKKLLRKMESPPTDMKSKDRTEETQGTKTDPTKTSDCSTENN